MSQVAILTHHRHSESLVEILHHTGLMQISQTTTADVEKGSMHPDVHACATYELRLTRILDILKQYEEKKKGIRASLRPSMPERQKVPARTLSEKLASADDVLRDVEEFIIDAEEHIEQIDKQIDEFEVTIANLTSILPLQIDLSWLGASHLLVLKVGLTTDLQALQASVQDMGIEVLSVPQDSKQDGWVVTLIARTKHADNLRKARPFDELEVSGKGTPQQRIDHLTKEKKELKKKRRNLVQGLRKIYHTRKSDILVIREDIHLEKRRKEIFERFGKTTYTSLIEGWTLTTDEDRLRTTVEDVTEGEVVFTAHEIPRDTEDAPIHLTMPKWAAPFSTFLELFALPRYNEINPSLFLGISFILFFAIMMGDAGYGTLIFLISLAAFLRLGKHSDIIKNWSFLGIWLGISTIVAGIIFNGFFGDFIPRFIYGDATQPLYDLAIMGHQFPIDALRKPLVILVIALILGLIHLNLGFLVAVYQNIKIGHPQNVLRQQIPWFLLQIGGGALIGSALLNLWQLSGPLMAISGIFTLLGFMALFVDKGPVGFFDVTGFAGDWLSYTRLLALGLATAGMALAFNIVAELMPKIVPYIGVILLPIILIVAHLANLAIQSLGAAIHSLRLQYVEFFNRFYMGGGKKFIPFQIKRKYTEEVK